MKAIRTFTVRPVLAESLAPLDRLASNWRWSWSRATHALFASMDPDLWERIGGNPSRMLGALGQDRLDELARDDDFLARVRDEAERLDAYLGGDRWFQQLEGPKPTGIAYFSPEFGVDGSLPQYSGGLGILAGDHLKSASSTSWTSTWSASARSATPTGSGEQKSSAASCRASGLMWWVPRP